MHRKRNRYQSRMFLVEGEDLLDAALAHGIIPRQVFVLEEYESLVPEEAFAGPPGGGPQTAMPDIYSCTADVMAKLSQLASSARVVAAFDMPNRKFPAGIEGGPVMYLAGARDPGNIGTLLRGSAAFGVKAMALGPQSADPYAAKAIRSSMGAIFQVPMYLTVNPEAIVSWAEGAGVDVICADSHTGDLVWDAPLAGDFVLVLGSEREGIPHRLKDAAALTVRIPQSEETESINVAMAGTAILYEAVRQRAGS